MYNYPDKLDIHVGNYLINPNWDDGGLERQYISECIAMIPGAQRELVLDVGCGGGGRLIKSYLPFFKKIIGVDADEERLATAKKVFEKLNQPLENPQQAEYILSFAENLQFQHLCDLIFCCHILQHRRTDTAINLLSKLRSYLKNDGFLIIETTNWIPGEPEFSKTDTIKHQDFTLTEKEFNKCVDQNDHFLPTHLYKDTELTNMLKQSGFAVIFLRKYHGYPKVRGDNFILAKAV